MWHACCSYGARSSNHTDFFWDPDSRGLEPEVRTFQEEELMIVQALFRNMFQWMLIAGLLLAVRSISNAPDELKVSEGPMLSARLGLTEIPVHVSAPRSR